MASTPAGNEVAEIFKQINGAVKVMALKCAVELRIADIIHSHNRPMKLYEIASCIDSPSPHEIMISSLRRIMRLLVHNKIFSISKSYSSEDEDEDEEALYGLTNLSKWILHDSDTCLVPGLLALLDPIVLAPLHFLSQSVKEGGIAFNKAHGCNAWDYFSSKNPELSKTFNDGMSVLTKIIASEILAGYKDGFLGIKSLVDVGGGIGAMISEIVKSYPHTQAINFDLPHVVATAPTYDGRVLHVGGDMFQGSIPKADAIFLKMILHDWNDEQCVKILKNCREAIPKQGGKIIIVDIVLDPEVNGLFGECALESDLLMMALNGGKERTETEWKKLLEKGGFHRYKIINLPNTFPSIIEAYPQ